MTKGLSTTSNDTEYFPPTMFANGSQTASGNFEQVPNAATLAVGAAKNTTFGDLMFHEYYDPGSHQLVVDIPVASLGAENQSQQDLTDGSIQYNQVLYEKMSVQSSGNAPYTVQAVTTFYNSGINTTGTQGKGGLKPDKLYQLFNLTAELIGFVKNLGYVTGGYAALKDLVGLVSVEAPPNFAQSANGSNPSFEAFDVVNGTLTGSCGSGCTSGNNGFASQAYFTVTVPDSELMTPATLTIQASNTMEVNVCNVLLGCAISRVDPGAAASIPIPMDPAVTLTGNVNYGSGTPDAGATVNIQDTSNLTTYQVKTDSGGNYRFFALPGAQYSISVTYQTPFGMAVASSSPSPLPDSPTQAWANLTVPSLYGWVKYNGYPESDAEVAITMYNGAVTYEYANGAGYYEAALPTNSNAYSIVALVYGFLYQPKSQVVSGNEAYLVDLNLTSVSPYPSISASGCNAIIAVSTNGDCLVEIDSVGGWSGPASLSDSVSPSSGLTVQQPYPSSVSVPAWGAASSYVQYFASTATGTYTIYVSDSYATTSFTVQVKSLGGGGGCVLAGTLIATPNGAKRVETLTAGDAVLGYNVTTGSWVRETVTSNSASTVSQVLSIDNGLLVTTLTEQPLYVRNGTWVGWVHDPQNLTVGEQVFLPWTGSWITITSLKVLHGTFTVYDLRVTAPSDFVANGVLSLDKCSRCT